MTNSKEQHRREQELAIAYEQQMKRRDIEIQKRITARATEGTGFTRNYLAVLSEPLLTGLASGKYQKPSECFECENAWILGSMVYERYRHIFLHMVDQIRDFPYSVSWTRRSFRSIHFSSYADRIGNLVTSFWRNGFIDADIYDILAGNLPEDTVCYLRSKNRFDTGFAPEVLAYELDQNNPRLERIVTDIINGEDDFYRVSRNLIRGIVLSHNERMHRQLCKLLLTARLQEGLRQAICEDADFGTREAFMLILSTIAENDLIRYSSVKRAVGTWLGLITEETRDLDRVSSKSVELVSKCLSDQTFRDSCLNSEDAMQIYIAIWSYAFESVESAIETLDQISREGSHHRMLTAGYFVNNLENPLLKQRAARAVLSRHRDNYDILAVYLPHLIPYQNSLASKIIGQHSASLVKNYFNSTEDAMEFCDWLVCVHSSMKKKELIFERCVFPWHKAVLKKSDLIEKAMVIAASWMDQSRIDALCPLIGDCEAFGRDLYFNIMTMWEKTPAVRKAIVKGLADKSADTRKAAYKRCKEIELSEDEYLAIEDMLRLRYDDLRRNVMELLLNRSDEQLESTIDRLLRASKTEKRIAALDMLTQLNKQDRRRHIAQRCMSLVNSLSKPTTQEQVLIDALTSTQPSAAAESLFTDEDRYLPVIELDDYAKLCIQEFMVYFPESKLEAQIFHGQSVTHGTKAVNAPPCPTSIKANEKLMTLSDLFAENADKSVETLPGTSFVLGSSPYLFGRLDPVTRQPTVPAMELWKQWQEKQQLTAHDLVRMLVYISVQNRSNPYLIQCGNYVADIYGSGYEKPIHYHFSDYVTLILLALIHEQVPSLTRRHLASALGIWIARCLPDDMLLGHRDVSEDCPQSAPNGIAYVSGGDNGHFRILSQSHFATNASSHFIAHPQIARLLFWLTYERDEVLRHIIPISVSLFDRTFASTKGFMESKLGQPLKSRQTTIFSQLYSGIDRYPGRYYFPNAATYLYAYHYDLISERTLYYHLMDPSFLKKALELVTAVCVIKPTEGNLVPARCFAHYRGNILRQLYESFIGNEKELDQEQLDLIQLCKNVAEKLLQLVVGEELLRGDSPTEYSLYITGIHSLSGAETFVRILSALGKDPLDRSVYYWGSNDSKRGNLSHLLARCTPSAEDTAETLRKLLKGTDISKKRLIEAALYTPEWIDIIGEYLNLSGFKSACYYFMAHMNEHFDEQKKAVIARFSPLSEDELNQGAFDVQWFHTAFEQLGENEFDLIYDAAKYISEGSKHTRARKYADAALGRLDTAETEAAIRDKRNKDLLMAYAIIPLRGDADVIHRYLFLQQFLKESRQFGSQRAASEKKAVETALRNLATNAGFSDTMRLILRMEAKLVEDNQELFRETQVGDWTLRLMVNDQGVPEVNCFKDGKQLKSIPSKIKKDPFVIRVLDMKKVLTEQHRRTRGMFEQAMEDCTLFRLEELRQLSQNRVVAPIVSKLVFKSAEELGLFNGENLIDLNGNVLTDSANAQLAVAHPIHLYQSGQWIPFQRYIFESKIIQPFKQVFRELYIKTKDELGHVHSLRYSGNQIQPKKAAACLKERRWVNDIEAGLQKVYYQENIVATMFALADWFSPADIEAPTLEYVAFFHRKTGASLKIDDVPDVIFSEVMRDVDMAVSVAHAGGVDPETSHSTVEMRSVILGFTLPLLRLDNVQIDGSHAIIQGKLAKYSVHLGSGVVHQIGGTMLNVLPVHSQHRGRFFLPFIDEDPKTAEIISKVILFSEDSKLKDPSILSQLTR